MKTCNAYETKLIPVKKEVLENLLAQKIDWICFTSASTSKGLEKAFKDNALAIPNIPCAVIGPVTHTAAIERGFNVKAVADPHTVDGLIEAMTNNSSPY